MAAAAAPIAVASTAISTVGGFMKASGQKKGAEAGQARLIAEGQARVDEAIALQEAREFEAEQLERQGGLTQASAQRAAREEKRRARILQSSLVARAAASGGGVADPTVANLYADIEAEGEYRAMSRLFEGRTEAESLSLAAEERRREGREALRAADRYLSGARTAGLSVLKAGSRQATGTMIGTVAKAAGQGASLYDQYYAEDAA